jgi:hypothetical protein
MTTFLLTLLFGALGGLLVAVVQRKTYYKKAYERGFQDAVMAVTVSVGTENAKRIQAHMLAVPGVQAVFDAEISKKNFRNDLH